jgi:hypothetical protein
MNIREKFPFARTTGKRLLGSVVLPVLFAAASLFAEDQQVLDALYNEIINASVREQGAADSGVPRSIPVDRLKVEPATDRNSEMLRQEIEKMVEEAKTRHSDAVKFMREDR